MIKSINLCERKLSNVTTDTHAWQAYPQHRRYFNKLDLALRLGHDAGPCGTAPEEVGEYIVRPTYNLEGMSLGAKYSKLGPHSGPFLNPGEFWCEKFNGSHISIDYKWELNPDLLDREQMTLRPIFACQGFRTSPHLYRFSAWRKITPPIFKLPAFLRELDNVTDINIEFIGGNIIEIHLRPNGNFPNDAIDIIPIWSDDGSAHIEMFEARGWKWQPSFEDAAGHMKINRLGFMYR